MVDASKTVSVSDTPLWGGLGGGSFNQKDDVLKTYKYADALATFIRQCDAPLTIGVQGEWGSGKTSLLNMIKNTLTGQVVKEGKSQARSKKDVKTIFINTWEHSLLRTPEESLLSIVQEIITSIAPADDESRFNSKKAMGALKKVAQGAAYTALTLTTSFKIADKAEQLLSGDPEAAAENTIKELRAELVNLVDAINGAADNDIQRFVVFIDDLDRLEPTSAVQILELLKNIFEIPHTIFVLAIDYEVVVKGLKGKFGEPTEENAWEFRAFFDKIIQVPFLMPMAQYNMKTYVERLLSDIQYFQTKNEREHFEEDIVVASQIVQRTMARNPRSLKRLANSLSLIRLQHSDGDLASANDYPAKILLFSLVCFQIGYPNIFELLLLQPDFTNWDDDGARRFIQSRGGDPDPADMDRALEAARMAHSGGFEEGEWETALFRVVWAMKWQRQKTWDACCVLNLMLKLSSKYTPDEEKRLTLLKDTLRLAATTSVISWDVNAGQSGEEIDAQDSGDKALRRAYWQEFSRHASGCAAFADGSIGALYSANGVKRSEPAVPPMSWHASISSTGFLAFEGDGASAKRFLEYLQSYKTRLADFCEKKGAHLTWDVKVDPAGKHRVRISPDGLERRQNLTAKENEQQRGLAMAWLQQNMESLADHLAKQWQQFEQRSAGNASQEQAGGDNAVG